VKDLSLAAPRCLALTLIVDQTACFLPSGVSITVEGDYGQRKSGPSRPAAPNRRRPTAPTAAFASPRPRRTPPFACFVLNGGRIRYILDALPANPLLGPCPRRNRKWSKLARHCISRDAFRFIAAVALSSRAPCPQKIPITDDTYEHCVPVSFRLGPNRCRPRGRCGPANMCLSSRRSCELAVGSGCPLLGECD
jgi:hypothetical protein